MVEKIRSDIASDSAPKDQKSSPPIEARGPEFFGSLSEEEIKAWENLVPAHRQRAIDPMSFSDLFDLASIKSDIAYTQRIEADISRNSGAEGASGRRRGELLEALVFWQIKYARWFGVDADAIAVSRYDDIANGVDLVVQFLKEGGFKFLALTIDVTSSPDKMADKLHEIKDDILKGKLSMIRYFDPDPKRKKQIGLKIRGELRDVPRVVVGIDNKALRELSLLKITISGAFKGARDEKNPRDLRMRLNDRHKEAVMKMVNHRAQMIVLEQIQLQLATFSKFARANDREGLASQYDNDLGIINEILGQKMASLQFTPEDFVANSEDEVFESLRVGLRTFK